MVYISQPHISVDVHNVTIFCWLRDLIKGLVKVPFFLGVTIFKGGMALGSHTYGLVIIQKGPAVFLMGGNDFLHLYCLSPHFIHPRNRFFLITRILQQAKISLDRNKH